MIELKRAPLTNENLEYIINSDSILSDRGYREICQEVLDTRVEFDVLRSEIARLLDLIKRLKENGERLLKHYTRDAGGYYVQCIHCLHEDYKDSLIIHSNNCPITLHRALMAEIEDTK